MRLLTFLTVAAVLTSGVAACGSDDQGSGSGDASVRVAATTTQVADMVRNVGGERAAVAGLLTPNSDPHDYEPRPADAKSLADARVVFRSGGDLDEWLGDVIASAGADAEVVDLMEAVRTQEGEDLHEEEEHAGEEEHAEEEGHDHGGTDPHWWQDPHNGEAAVRRIAEALAKADPDGRATYEANATRYVARLHALDEAIAACMQDIPEEQRKLVTNHDALGYFADRYDIEVVGAVIPALSTQARASAGETQQLVETIRHEGVTTIFPESSLNPKLEKAIAAEAGAKVGPALWADTLGPEGSSGATYLDALRFNASAMAQGFSDGRTDCDLPER